MGYDITRFDCEVDEDLMCCICFGVLEEPLHAPQCEHAFCKSCINEWLTRQPSCPVDRQRITSNELKPPRVVRNFLSRLMIKCDKFGCITVVQLERLEAHEQECEHNPKRPVPCDQGCGLAVPKDELKDHNCFREVMGNFQTEMHRIRSCIQEHIPAVEDVTRWANSLPRARVTNWGYLISEPIPVTCAMVRAALHDSGCPAHTAAKLTENASEERWPAGLGTVGDRLQNRQYFGNYVFRRIPMVADVQAVVVMAGDNPHINDDFVLVPGLVMIFFSGSIE